MPNNVFKPLSILFGVLIIIFGMSLGPLGVLISLTGIGRNFISLYWVANIIWIISLLILNSILSKRYKKPNVSKVLFLYIVVALVDIFLHEYSFSTSSSESLSFAIVFISVLKPIIAIFFYIALLKIDKLWTTIFGVFIGLFCVFGLMVNTIDFLNQIGTIFVVFNKSFTNYVNTYVLTRMFGGAVISMVQMVQSFVFGGLLIGGSLSLKD